MAPATADQAQDRATKRRGPPGAGSLRQRLHLASGIVLFSFALVHFFNHSLGLISIVWMEAMEETVEVVWKSLPGTILLVSAFFYHVVSALLRTIARRSFRLTPMMWLQLILGFLIPYQLIAHAIYFRAGAEVFGMDADYFAALPFLWPNYAMAQSGLLVVVWLHGVIGLHLWLRLKPWYDKAFPALLAFAVLLPLAAIAGWIDAARRLAAEQPGMPERISIPGREAIGSLVEWVEAGHWILAVAVGIAIAVPLLRYLWSLRSRRITVNFPGGVRHRTAAGPTLLEISQLAGVPHTSVCGGRGRCSTCRTVILNGLDTLDAAEGVERIVLDRIAAEPRVRLACQIRPTADLTVHPIMPADRRQAISGTDRFDWGVERSVAVMFIDLRGFTSLSEQRLPYDIVFLLKRYLALMSAAIERSGGQIDKFIGDGIMAIFGISSGLDAGCRQALEATRAIGQALDTLNSEFGDHIGDELRIGVGIHAGPVILGRVGAAGTSGGITALGDTVNTASRLESANKELGAVAVASEVVLKHGGVRFEKTDWSEIEIRGRREMLRVASTKSFGELVPETVPAKAAEQSV
ncbi:MAG: adenylate/guanylate cyclase domain-containing protein [Hyphomicrobiales bacterium]|nr:adenylate/guanylate cyclase domain-containing protein [Hyphomicrobiales bacterium]